MNVITDPQYNYLKGLMKKVGNKVYQQTRLEFNISPDLTERQLSKKEAQRLIGHLKARADKGKKRRDPLSRFEVETSYNTTMECETEGVLLDWAKKRFKRDQLSLKQIQKLVANSDMFTVSVPGYKIKRCN